MECLSPRDLKAVLVCVSALHVQCGLDAFPQRVLDAARGLVGSDVTCYTELNPPAQRALFLGDPPDSFLYELLPVFAEFQGQHPRYEDFVESNDTGAHTISEYLSVAEWERRDLYNLFFRRMGLNAQLTVLFPTRKPLCIGIALNRRARTFSDRDRAVMNVLRPHLALAYRNALAFQTLTSELCAARGALDETDRGVVVLSADRLVTFMSDRARTWLRRYFPPHGPEAGPLPDALRNWIRRIAGDMDEEAPLAMEHALTIHGPDGLLRISLVRPEDSSHWLLVLEEVRAPEAPPGPPLPRLTPRLREVLALLLEGQSEKQVARALELSRHTVHDYVKELYHRLDVSSRSELLARWVRG